MDYLEDALELKSQNNFSFIAINFPIDIGSSSMLERLKSIQEQITLSKNSDALMVS